MYNQGNRVLVRFITDSVRSTTREWNNLTRARRNSLRRRAKLVLPTERGHEVIAIAQGLVPELEGQVTKLLGVDRTRALRQDLETIRRTFTS
jgi:DNA-binding MarR family transcriptional regulator